MESALDQIRRTLPDIRRLQAENVALKKENSLLKAQVARQEREIRSMRDSFSTFEFTTVRPRDPPPSIRPTQPPQIVIEEPEIFPEIESVIDEIPFESDVAPQPKEKPASALPPRSTIPSIIAALSETDPPINQMVISVLIESYPSIGAMKKFCVDLLNSVFTKILETDKTSAQMKSYVAFLVQLSKKVSWIVYEQVIERLSGDPELRAVALTAGEFSGEEEDL